MSNLELFGPPQSSYVRTARWACSEKGVAHTLVPIDLGSDAHAPLHPWRKVPVLRHGDVHLYETAAITRYVDDAFDGPSLTPEPPVARARMEQWVSAVNCYLYDDCVRSYALQYIFPAGPDGAPDRATIEPAVQRLEHAVAQLDAAYSRSEWIAGPGLSIADLFVGPVVATFGLFPEGAAALEAAPNLKRAFTAIRNRSQYQSIQPPSPKP